MTRLADAKKILNAHRGSWGTRLPELPNANLEDGLYKVCQEL